MAQHYAPEDVSGAVLATQLAEDLASKGFGVTFITAAPSYPRNIVFNGYKNKIYQTECLNGVHIIRTWSIIPRSKSFISRVLNQISFSISCFVVGLIIRKFDLIFSYSPPLFLGFSAAWLSKIKKIPWVLRVEDLFPDTAIAGNIIKNQTLIKVLYWMEKQLYHSANHISLISETFKKNLINKGIPSEKISVLPVWADPTEIQVSEKQNNLHKNLNSLQRFLVLYSGNIGHTSNLESIIPVAKALEKEPIFSFLIIGEGIKKRSLIDLATKHNLRNIDFLPYQKREFLPNILASADLCIVSEASKVSAFSLPSKTFTYMASARPILAIAPFDSEIAQLITAAKCGIVVQSEDIKGICNAIQYFYENPNVKISMGLNGRKTLEEKYSRSKIIQQFHELIIRYAN